MYAKISLFLSTDNAYDPDVNAKQFWIDKTMVKGQECLVFMDNGNGLDHATMHKMLRYRYCCVIFLSTEEKKIISVTISPDLEKCLI